jgi:hypothetical protein
MTRFSSICFCLALFRKSGCRSPDGKGVNRRRRRRKREDERWRRRRRKKKKGKLYRDRQTGIVNDLTAALEICIHDDDDDDENGWD